MPASHVAKPASTHEAEELLSGAKWDSSFEPEMRIHFSSIARPKAVAKKLKTSLSFLGISLRLSEVQELAAAIYGYQNWHELQKAIGTSARSLDDEAAASSLVVARREYQIMRLVEAGVSLNKATYAVAMIGPSSRNNLPFTSMRAAYKCFEELCGLIGATGFRFYTRGEASGTLAFRVAGRWVEDPIRRRENAMQLNQLEPGFALAGISMVWPE